MLVCHSLGCHLAAKFLSGRATGVAGALLVAPPDLEGLLEPGMRRGDLPASLASFFPSVREPLSVPTTVVMSTSDPYASVEAMSGLAKAWGSDAVTAVEASGHINLDSGHGEWAEGLRLLDELVARIEVDAKNDEAA